MNIFDNLITSLPMFENEGEAGGSNAGQEGDRFKGSEGGGIPEGMEDKFIKDGKVNIEALNGSYVELQKKLSSKSDDLKEEWKTEQLANRPKDKDVYTIPKIEHVDAEEMANHPFMAFWRDHSFNMGLDQTGFENGVNEYINTVVPNYTEEDQKKDLGENHKTRIEVATNWMEKNLPEATQFQAVASLVTTGDGIKAIETLMGIHVSDTNGEGDKDLNKGLTADKLKEMQADPRYYDPNRRESAFVKQVDEGYQQLYAKK